MGEHYDAVVVGSGFGGSVIACRLAEANKSVCVLERGRRYAPGSFVRSPSDMRRNFWDPGTGRRGLFDVWSFRSMESVVSAGLGGGSLIYANVLIRKDERWFVQNGTRVDGYEHWPVDRAELEPFYDNAEDMLGAQEFPFADSPFDRSAKTAAMREAALALGIPLPEHSCRNDRAPEWFLPLLAVSFANDGRPPNLAEALVEDVRNLHNVDRQTCRLCGECNIGCNFGAKNTLDLTYLSSAHAKGACIRTLCEVKSVEPEGAGYRVGYIAHVDDEVPQTEPAALEYVTCRKLFLAAGTFGTTYVLLNNRTRLRGLSDRVGQRFSGNGDLLSFVFNATRRDSRGRTIPRAFDCSHDPVITSTFRFPDAVDGGTGRGFYLQDAGYPDLVDWALEAGSVRGNVRRAARFILGRIAAFLFDSSRSRIGGDLAALVGTKLSRDSMPLLGMGRDTPDGVMTVRTDRNGEIWLELNWSSGHSRAYLGRVEGFSRHVAGVLGGKFVLDPFTGWLNRLITVHPLGGAAMSRSPVEGVVDRWGEVWGHRNLFVVDGAAMPGPVGANPSLTIAAFAERCARHVLDG